MCRVIAADARGTTHSDMTILVGPTSATNLAGGRGRPVVLPPIRAWGAATAKSLLAPLFDPRKDSKQPKDYCGAGAQHRQRHDDAMRCDSDECERGQR